MTSVKVEEGKIFAREEEVFGNNGKLVNYDGVPIFRGAVVFVFSFKGREGINFLKGEDDARR